MCRVDVCWCGKRKLSFSSFCKKGRFLSGEVKNTIEEGDVIDSTSVAISISDGKKVLDTSGLFIQKSTKWDFKNQEPDFPILARLFRDKKVLSLPPPFSWHFLPPIRLKCSRNKFSSGWLTGLMDRVSHKLFNRAAATLSKRMGKSFWGGYVCGLQYVFNTYGKESLDGWCISN